MGRMVFPLFGSIAWGARKKDKKRDRMGGGPFVRRSERLNLSRVNGLTIYGQYYRTIERLSILYFRGLGVGCGFGSPCGGGLTLQFDHSLSTYQPALSSPAPGDASYIEAERAAVAWVEAWGPRREQNSLIVDAIQAAGAAPGDGLSGGAGLGLSAFHISPAGFDAYETLLRDRGIAHARIASARDFSRFRDLRSTLDARPLSLAERAELDYLTSKVARATPGAEQSDLDARGYWRFDYALGGRVARLASVGAATRGKAPEKRGAITGFSWASRRRLLVKSAAIDTENFKQPDGSTLLPLFVTLTYHYAGPDPRVYKRDLDTFLKRLKRRHPRACGIWRLEFQKRGVPHYHLLLCGVNRVDKIWLSWAWASTVAKCAGCRFDNKTGCVVRSESCICDLKHFQAGTQVKRVETWRGVQAYASKGLGQVMGAELGKTIQANCYDPETGEFISVGRWWGIFNKKCLPILMVSTAITEDLAYKVRRSLRAWLSREIGRDCQPGREKSTTGKRWRKLPAPGRYKGQGVFLSSSVADGLLDHFMGLPRGVTGAGFGSVSRHESVIKQGERIAALRVRLMEYQLVRG